MVEKETVFEFLDNLRESGVTNMFGAGPYVESTFGVSRHEARDLVVQWMKSFSTRHAN